MDVTLFFPPGTRIRQLPNTKNPRLFFSGENPVKRWHKSAMYPAFRKSAHLYRLALRVKAAIGFDQGFVSESPCWELKDFVEDIFPSICEVVILIGTLGPTEKIIAQIWDQQKIVAYMKYAERPSAIARVNREQQVLTHLPKGLGPKVLKHGTLKNGVALLLTPIEGRSIPLRMFPSSGIKNFLYTLPRSQPTSLDDHPWIKKIRKYHAPLIDSLLEPLSKEKWAVVVQHGDFVPWNIHGTSSGKLQAIDWEYGEVQGFPYLDLVYYVLQVSRLIYYADPLVARDCAVNHLRKEQENQQLTALQAHALVRLAAYFAYQECLRDGHGVDTNSVVWWKNIWSLRN